MTEEQLELLLLYIDAAIEAKIETGWLSRPSFDQRRCELEIELKKLITEPSP